MIVLASSGVRKFLRDFGVKAILPAYALDEKEHADFIAHATAQHPEEDAETAKNRGIARLIYQNHHYPKKKKEKHSIWFWIALGLMLLLLFSNRAHAQRQLDGLQIQDSGGLPVHSWFGGLAKIKCGANTGCTYAGGVLTFAANGSGVQFTSGGSTANVLTKSDGAFGLQDSVVTDNTATGGYVVVSGSLQTVGGFNTTQLGTSPTPAVVCSSGSGTTYGYRVIAYDANVWPSTRSNQTTVSCAATLDAGHANTITWTALANATSYKVVRTASGGTPANLSLVCTVNTGSALTCLDDGSINTAAFNTPTFNSTGGIKLPNCTSTMSDANIAQFPVGGGISSGQIGAGICFDSQGGMIVYSPIHDPMAYFWNGLIMKWSQPIGWSPDGVFPNAGTGLSIMGDNTVGGGTVDDTVWLDVGRNNTNNSTVGAVSASGYMVALTATAALTAGQVVKVDSANASSVVVATTTDTGAGIPIGFVKNSPGVAGVAHVILQGKAVTPVLGTGTCTIGQFVIVDTTTNGRVKCTSSFTAGTILGTALTAQASVAGTVTVLVQPR